MPKIDQEFTVAHDRSLVWERFQDLPEIVGCIPGASLTEQASSTQAKGQMTVKLGPVRANFAGEADIAPDPENFTGTIEGKGMDKSHASRAKATVVYVLEEADGGAATRVRVSVDYPLSGSLAQFARGGIVDAIADQITEEFTGNLEAQLAESAAGNSAGAGSGEAASPEAPAASARPAETKTGAAPAGELNLFALVWRMLKKRFKALFGGK
ncbi:SRPBCC family protein [Afifella pfennigii]|uniref:SRPBCC family protein n=1 Tax=Afifella pfennigii TaxID=209897 RepID=UPI00068C22CE|nr:SRPBCC family protein [Afifella pfennigii]